MVAPIALFCFRRPLHLERTLAALAANRGAADHDLVAFADGPRRADDGEGVAAVARVLEGWRGRNIFRSFAIHRQEANLGLARSVIAGVGQVVAEAGRVIVVEDDLVTSPEFLGYMRDALDRYAEDPRVGCIHGYCYPVDVPLPESFFLRGADCWGWATWGRAWSAFQEDGAALRSRLRGAGLMRSFDLEGAGGFAAMLDGQIAGTNDSWAIRWHASAFLAGLLTLYPGRSLVRNIGLDGSGTHCGTEDAYDAGLAASAPVAWPVAVAEDAFARAAFVRYLRRRNPGLLRRLLRRLKGK